MRVRMMIPARLALLLSSGLALFAMVGCMSNEAYVRYHTERKARIQAAYPVGMSRAELHAQLHSNGMSPTTVPNSGTRPAAGWSASPAVPGDSWCDAAEARTGRTVASFERYSMVDGLFSLCYHWFYFDEADILVDVDWQYQSD